MWWLIFGVISTLFGIFLTFSAGRHLHEREYVESGFTGFLGVLGFGMAAYMIFIMPDTLIGPMRLEIVSESIAEIQSNLNLLTAENNDRDLREAFQTTMKEIFSKGGREITERQFELIYDIKMRVNDLQQIQKAAKSIMGASNNASVHD